MKRRTVALICLLYVVVAVFVFLYFFGFPPFYRIVPSTVSEIKSNPEFWVGKRVRVQGVLMGPLMFIPEEVPPYNYALQDPNTREAVGVLWREFGSRMLGGENVTIVGVVRKGYTHPLIVRTVYYIEAEMIHSV